MLPAWEPDLRQTLNQYVRTRCQSCRLRTPMLVPPRVSVVGIDENAAMEAIVKHLAEQGIASAAYMAGNELSSNRRNCSPHSTMHMRTYGLATESEKLEPVRRTYRAARFRLRHTAVQRAAYTGKPWSAPTIRSRSA